MKKEELKYSMEDTLETAKEMLLKDGKLVPMAFMQHEDNIDIIALSFRDSYEKNRQLSLLRDIVRKKNAGAVFLLTESWYVTTDSHHLTMEPSKDPKRKECIMIIGECEDANLSIIQLFDRDNGKIVFGEKVDIGETISPKFHFGIKDGKKKNKKQNEDLRDLN